MLFLSVPLLASETKLDALWSSKGAVFEGVKYLRNYDGDTITFDLRNVHPLLGDDIGVRVRGIDTPEIKGKGPCEKAKAYEAKRIVSLMLKNASNIRLENCERGKYFRIVCDVIAHRSVADELIARGLATRYDGGTKEKIDWCKMR